MKLSRLRSRRRSLRLQPSAINYYRLCLEVLEDRLLPGRLTFVSTDVPKAIPDVGTVSSTIKVGDPLTIGDLNVRIDIDHTSDRELSVFLVAPDTTRVELFSGVGGIGSNFRRTILDDEATVSIEGGEPPFAGVFRPAEALSNFDSKDARGEWRLEIADNGGNGSGVLREWELIIDSEPMSTGLFARPEFYSAGSPRSVTLGDLNADGVLDLVTANFQDDNVSILLGVGDGTFRPEARFATGSGPSAVAIGDYDGDGNADLAVTSLGRQVGDTSSISVLMGQGDGSFGAEQRFEAGTDQGDIVAADFDRDGDLDLATASFLDGSFDLLLNRGDGTFQQTQRLGFFAGGIATADFTRDGFLDVATTSAVYINSGGAFIIVPIDIREDISRGIPRFVRHDVVTGDFNGDGLIDIASSGDSLFGRQGSEPPSHVAVVLGLSDRRFSSETRYEVGELPLTIAAGDFNGDTRIDLVTANNFGGLSILLGRGDGTFADEFRIDLPFRPTGLALADLNGDGLLDLITGNSAASTVAVFLGNPLPDLIGRFTIRGFVGSGFDDINLDNNWGDTIPLVYSIANKGRGTAGPFNVEFRLSPDSTITTSDRLVASVTLAGLAIGETIATVQVRLPGRPGQPPGKFTEPDVVYIGMLIDVGNDVIETNDENAPTTTAFAVIPAPISGSGTSNSGFGGPTPTAFVAGSTADSPAAPLSAATIANSGRFAIVGAAAVSTSLVTGTSPIEYYSPFDQTETGDAAEARRQSAEAFSVAETSELTRTMLIEDRQNIARILATDELQFAFIPVLASGDESRSRPQLVIDDVGGQVATALELVARYEQLGLLLSTPTAVGTLGDGSRDDVANYLLALDQALELARQALHAEAMAREPIEDFERPAERVVRDAAAGDYWFRLVVFIAVGAGLPFFLAGGGEGNEARRCRRNSVSMN